MKHVKAISEGSGLSILEQLQNRGIFLPADCGGNGTCGKCLIRFVKNPPEPTPKEKKFVSEKKLEQGWRLACETRLEGEFEIEFDQSEDEIVAQTEFQIRNGSDVPEEEPEDAGGEGTMIAVDIGTTTVAASLVDTAQNKVLDTRTCINHQRSFGADVISRIKASNEGDKEKLKSLIREDLAELTRRLGQDPETIRTVISGNTTMQHLLEGLSCETLGVAPYTPVDISLHEDGLFTLLPGISTYVGADIVSGIIACGMDQSDEVCILIDLGTNGEMAIGNKDRILVASTAAGPAFEGGNITCGVAGIPGAISSVEINDGTVTFETIGGKEPVGLCGTGVLEVMYELLKEELVDETGCMDEEYFDDGFPVSDAVVFTEKDVREVQLAKSAIRAGAETLIKEYGVDYGQVRALYLAGGFGQKINLKKAAGIGLLPEELLERTEAVGNSSLAGAVLYAKNPAARERFVRVSDKAEEVSLTGNPFFNDLYMEHMMFE